MFVLFVGAYKFIQHFKVTFKIRILLQKKKKYKVQKLVRAVLKIKTTISVLLAIKSERGLQLNDVWSSIATLKRGDFKIRNTDTMTMIKERRDARWQIY